MKYMYGVTGVLACCVDDVPVPSCLRDFYGATPMCMILARASAVPGGWSMVSGRMSELQQRPHPCFLAGTNVSDFTPPSRDTPTSP